MPGMSIEDIFLKIIKASPSLRTPISLAGVIVGATGYLLIKNYNPDDNVGQIIAGSTGILIIFFGQIFVHINSFPSRHRAPLIIGALLLILVFFGFALNNIKNAISHTPETKDILIYGKVVDNNNQVVPGVRISFPGYDQSAKTNPDGSYSIHFPVYTETTSITAQTHHSSYRTTNLSSRIPEDNNLELNFEILP